MIGHLKKTPFTAPDTTALTSLFRFDNSAIAWAAAPDDEFMHVNTELFTVVHDKKYLIGPAVGALNGTLAPNLCSNDAKSHITGYKKVFKNKHLLFEDATQNVPTNANYFIWAMSYRVDGVDDPITEIPIQLAFQSTLFFKTY